MHVNERYRTKEERSKQGPKKMAKRRGTPKVHVVTFPKKNELPQVVFEPTTLHTLDRVTERSTNACTLYNINYYSM